MRASRLCAFAATAPLAFLALGAGLAPASRALPEPAPVAGARVEGTPRASALTLAAMRDLRALGAGWEAIAEPASGAPSRLWGPPLTVPGDSLRARALAFLRARPALVGFRDGEDGYELSAGEPFRAGPVEVVPLEQRWHGFPVLGVRADVRFARGALVMARLHLGRGIDAARQPTVGADAARRLARRAVEATGRVPSSPARLDAARPLVVMRREDGWALAWAVRLDTADPPGKLTVFVDAVSGAALAEWNEVKSGAVQTPLTLEVSHEPRRAGDPEVVSPLPFYAARDGADTFVTSSAGVAAIPVSGASRQLDLALEGDYARVVVFGAGSSVAAVQVDAGVPQTFTWDADDATLSERDAAASHAVVRARMKRMAPDLPFVDSRITLEVDVPSSQGCNAYWAGDTAQFYEESATCNATARVADVVYHEIGHGLHQALAGGGFVPADVGEGSADYLAATITGDPDIGPSFFKTQAEGIRNLEPDAVYPDDLVGQVHTDGLIWGGAFWDLRSELIALLGSDAGVILADRIFADTLRLNPVLDDGFWDVLLAADDDGNVSNGGPYECQIVESFGRHGLGPGRGLGIGHQPLGLQPPAAPAYRIRAYVSGAFPRCGSTPFEEARLEWRREGDAAWNEAAMGADLVPGWHMATIPGHPEGTVLEYRVVVIASGGGVTSSPGQATASPFRFRVADPEIVFEDDFEGEDDNGWTHELVDGPVLDGADDWQRGTPLGRANDPTAAFSGSNVWGNDLGAAPYNGAYQPNIHNRLESPVIDCRRCAGTRLSFRRWLGVEASQMLDVASVWIDGARVWSNPPADRVRDQEWRFEEIDISDVADGERFRIRFELQSGPAVQMGGWNLDDVRVTREGEYRAGSCSCALGSRARPAPLVVLVAALGAIVVRRRRAQPA